MTKYSIARSKHGHSHLLKIHPGFHSVAPISCKTLGSVLLRRRISTFCRLSLFGSSASASEQPLRGNSGDSPRSRRAIPLSARDCPAKQTEPANHLLRQEG